MTEVRLSEVLLRNLDKEIVLLSYDYEEDEVRYIGDDIKLWSFVVMMYILNKNIKAEKMIEKLENIIKYPKILVVFVNSLSKILYVWLKDYDMHCRLMMRLYPELYNPKRLLMIHNTRTGRGLLRHNLQ
jgi:hypothetical protein